MNIIKNIVIVITMAFLCSCTSVSLNQGVNQGSVDAQSNADNLKLSISKDWKWCEYTTAHIFTDAEAEFSMAAKMSAFLPRRGDEPFVSQTDCAVYLQTASLATKSTKGHGERILWPGGGPTLMSPIFTSFRSQVNNISYAKAFYGPTQSAALPIGQRVEVWNRCPDSSGLGRRSVGFIRFDNDGRFFASISKDEMEERDKTQASWYNDCFTEHHGLASYGPTLRGYFHVLNVVGSELNVWQSSDIRLRDMNTVIVCGLENVDSPSAQLGPDRSAQAKETLADVFGMREGVFCFSSTEQNAGWYTPCVAQTNLPNCVFYGIGQNAGLARALVRGLDGNAHDITFKYGKSEVITNIQITAVRKSSTGMGPLVCSTNITVAVRKPVVQCVNPLPWDLIGSFNKYISQMGMADLFWICDGFPESVYVSQGSLRAFRRNDELWVLNEDYTYDQYNPNGDSSKYLIDAADIQKMGGGIFKDNVMKSINTLKLVDSEWIVPNPGDQASLQYR